MLVSHTFAALKSVDVSSVIVCLQQSLHLSEQEEKKLDKEVTLHQVHAAVKKDISFSLTLKCSKISLIHLK